MGLGASLFLIAGGAILVWGVDREVAGIDVDAIGVILMVVGIVGARALDDLLVIVGRRGRPPARNVRRRRPTGHRRAGLLEARRFSGVRQVLAPAEPSTGPPADRRSLRGRAPRNEDAGPSPLRSHRRGRPWSRRRRACRRGRRCERDARTSYGPRSRERSRRAFPSRCRSGRRRRPVRLVRRRPESRLGGEVDSGVEPVAARAEDVADGRDQRACEAERAARDRPAQGSHRGRPSDPVGPIPAHRWKLRSAASVCEPRTPSKFPDGKPCQASANWSAATSHPCAPSLSSRRPSGERKP